MAAHAVAYSPDAFLMLPPLPLLSSLHALLMLGIAGIVLITHDTFFKEAVVT